MQGPTLLGRSILVVEDEPLIVMDITQAFAHTGAEMTTTNTLRHALMLVEHDGLSAAILDIPWATVTVRTFARDSRIAASPSSSIAGSLKSKARVTGHRISTNRRPPRSWLPQWKACSRARRRARAREGFG